MTDLTIEQLHGDLLAKKFSATEATNAHLEAIASRDSTIGAYLHVANEDALSTAARVDEAIARGDSLSAVAGVPIGVKDTILVSGAPCTAGSNILKPYVAAYDATVTKKLKSNDAVLMGKLNCDEFAMGSSTESSAFRATVNPWDQRTVPGGSSGGSAAAVASGLCVAALGSDTGGSIRQPAALCGVVGLKPTYGSVSRYGLMAMASSFDVIGPIARRVADVRTMFHAIRGKDAHDATSSDGIPVSRGAAGSAKLRIGVPEEYFGQGIDDDVAASVRDAIAVLEQRGHTIEEVSLPLSAYALAVYYVLMPCEASANLERYDGIRYGASVARSVPETALDGVYIATRTKGFGPEVQRRIMMGTYALSAGYADQYYKRALAVRQRIRREFEDVFTRVDVLITPTSPTPAWKFGEKTDDPMKMYLSDIFTVSANVAGIPALSLPCGFVERDGASLPVGLQLMGKWFDEETLLSLGEAYEQVTEWHKKKVSA
jgi:aspartyl-tRNA(Asn)/glutamyl-tRNA(Gln) amidotransferase subunit A